MMLKERNTTHLIALFLILTLNFGVTTSVRAQAQPTIQRERTVTTPPTVRPTPAPNRAPAPTPTPRPTLVPTPSAPVTSIPAQDATAAPRTIEDLRARINEVLRQPQLAPAQMAVKVASLDTGRTLFEENAGRYLHPASNMKLYTVAAALARLGPDFRFTTAVYSQVRPDAGIAGVSPSGAGTVRGDLIIYGRGDPSFAARFNDGDYMRAIDDLAARIVAAGVRSVQGDIVGDESYFSGAPLGQGWEWDDLQWYYGAEVSALSVNDNAIDLFVMPGTTVGASCAVTTGPRTPSITINTAPSDGSTFAFTLSDATLVHVINRTATAARGARRNITVHRPLNSNTIEVSGTLPLDDPGYTGYVAVTRPAMLFTIMLRDALVRRGVQVSGRARTVDARSRNVAPLQTTSLVELANRQSPPLSEIAAQTLKPSQNLYTELLLRALGERYRTNPRQTSVEAGVEAVDNFLREAGVGSVIMADGSGLSRGNLVTANATVQLLAFMSRHQHAAVFRDAQPIAGVDGTLRTRMRGTPAEGNVRAKTGTLTGVTALSGYATSAAGERLVFSLIVNNYPRDVDARVVFTDRIAVLLASFTGRS